VDDITRQFALRDEMRRKLAQRKSFSERMRDMAALQEKMWATLRQSPDGYAHFIRRNFKARAVPVRDSNAR
jgi:hypothetical protein